MLAFPLLSVFVRLFINSRILQNSPFHLLNAVCRHRHSTHHRETNILTSDPDLKTYPLIVYNEQVQQTSSITQYQRTLLPLYLILRIHPYLEDSFNQEMCEEGLVL